jgi:hypothetical protein
MTNAFLFCAPNSAFRVCPGRWFLVQIKEIVDFEGELAGGEELTFQFKQWTRSLGTGFERLSVATE